jgi:orotate phosphoribosyltransferase
MIVVKEETALKIAQFLLQIKAIRLNPKNPFTWASGWKSPIYCDNRITLSFPVIRTYIRQQFVEIIKDEFGDIDLIAGIATGGIAHGALVAQDLGLPFAYVRTSKKDHGLSNQIEGVIGSGQSVILIEDLISTGMSSMMAVQAVKDKGANVKGLISIFTYGFDVAGKKFEDAGCKVFSLCNYDFLLKQALEDNYVQHEDLAVLEAWKSDPEHWNQE